ncbi:MAG: prolyl-tRNA synthetase associated domain-containing protein [Bacteroidales bacterium]|nr:prolyl-tRNA synthetase associated domain-containing protein [Bacteroidales bacterium]MCF8343435.1 prolyl-tRNA synthetase associated domain-containing protein [Bacteroidales bacterium]MCF8349890.1 prolyl-tRNA synthetase associated domain-containing protein [Bacteroidales bacterium]MCF8376771.1 prolyl-tRNA synthetase associated domain-containing protein [Bacteroidales bacterium]
MTEQEKQVIEVLEDLSIDYRHFTHPPIPTIEEGLKHWKNIDATHCKNLFFRNHKGKKHYLVILDHRENMAIHDMEKRLKQGKLSFASEKRLQKWLGLTPGSVTPFGLINDAENHVHVFLDENLKTSKRISFHPNINTATVDMPYEDFIRFLDWTGNSWEYVRLYDHYFKDKKQ